MVFVTSAVAAWAQPVQIPLVPVGDPGNVPDPLTGYGSVGHSYSIGEYDVTVSQYVGFLNSIATSSDPYGCWNPSMSNATPTYGITRTSTSAGYVYAAKGSSANVPVTYVSWADAARFCNWLQNGEPLGSEGTNTTETGSYDLNGSTGSAQLMQVTRSTTATWVIPTLNEFYKAAYYVGGGTNAGYWQYPTQNDSPPSNVLSATGTNNANFTQTQPTLTLSDSRNWLTPVGAFVDSPGAYGTYDMGGDVDEWDEAVYPGIGRGVNGGSWAGGYLDLNSGLAGGGAGPPSAYGQTTGFRVALVPEPQSLFLAACLALGPVLAGAFQWLRRSRTRMSKRQSQKPAQCVSNRLLRFEALEDKRPLTTLVFDSTLGDSWNTGEDWRVGTLSGQQTAWSDGSDAVIPAGSGIIEIAPSTTVSPNSITFQAGANYTVTGGELGLVADLTFDVQAISGTTTQAEIDSTISGSGYQLTKINAGGLTLGGNVTVAGIHPAAGSDRDFLL
jgi:formylglycine-generating enzyme required for sulfatase activity